jgi:hypothetical protein
MADTFKDRAAIGEAFADAVMNLFQSDGLIDFVGRSGGEFSHIAPVLDQVRRLADPMARRLRFNPDGTIIAQSTGMAHWEAKASRAIEREPYEFYVAYERAAEPVLLVIAPDLVEGSAAWRRVFIGLVRYLVLIDGEVTVAEFPPDLRYPLREGWIAPRENPRGSARGSGTEYRYIDISASHMLQVAWARKQPDNSVVIRPDLFVGDTVKRTTGAASADNRLKIIRRQFLEAFTRWVVADRPPEDVVLSDIEGVASAMRQLSALSGPRGR